MRALALALVLAACGEDGTGARPSAAFAGTWISDPTQSTIVCGSDRQTVDEHAVQWAYVATDDTTISLSTFGGTCTEAFSVADGKMQAAAGQTCMAHGMVDGVAVDSTYRVITDVYTLTSPTEMTQERVEYDTFVSDHGTLGCTATLSRHFTKQ